jgi:O-antigen/teichoic acid export membrane protein
VRSIRGHVQSAAWTGIDQVLGALSNTVVAIALTRAGGVASLGRYSVAFACYLLVLLFHRQLVTEPLMSLPWQPAASGHEQDRSALGASLLYLAATSLAVLAVGLGTRRLELIVLAPLLPGVCVQDFGRYVAFRRQRQQLAAGLDALWTILSAASYYLVLRSGSPAVAVAAWGVAGGIAGLYGVFRLRLVPARLSIAVRWWQHEARRLGGFLTVAGMAYTAGSQGVALGIAATIGEAALGQLREAQIILGPAGLTVTAFSFFVLPRLASHQGEITYQMSGLLTLAAALIAGIAAAISLPFAPWISRLVFGHLTAISMALLLPLSVQLTLEAAASGVVLPLQVTQGGAAIAVARVVSVALGIPAIILAASIGGIVLAAWASAAQAGVYLLASWMGWRRRARNRRRDQHAAAP